MTRDGTDDAAARGGRRWSLQDLEPRPESVALVRHEVRTVLAGWDADRFEWEVCQLVTELATNVVLHARTIFDVSMELDGDRLRLEVCDASPQLPRTRRFSRESTTGRGMRLVETLAQTWGVERGGAGKTVWVVLVPAHDVDGGPVELDRWFDDDEPAAAPARSGGAGATVSAAPVSWGPGTARAAAVLLIAARCLPGGGTTRQRRVAA